MIGKEILIEIDSTLDHLIRNAEAMQDVSFDQLSEIEADAFQKTQESLLHRLMHLDESLQNQTQNLRVEHKKTARFQIQAKKERFAKLKASYHHNLCTTLARKSDILSKRRGKKLIPNVTPRF